MLETLTEVVKCAYRIFQQIILSTFKDILCMFVLTTQSFESGCEQGVEINLLFRINIKMPRSTLTGLLTQR